MKPLITFAVLTFFLFSCSMEQGEDIAFKRMYCSMLDTMATYYDFIEMKEDIPVHTLRKRSKNFEKNAKYLAYLTNIEFHCTEVEHILIYSTKSDYLLDKNALKKWYRKNKYGMTIHKADSMVMEKRRNSNNKYTGK